MKKILLLGGSKQQIPAIECAKRKGYCTVLCDYLPDNPGQKFVDKFYLESTTDKDAILKIAQKEKIDGIVAYASDPAAPTAAYVAEQLGLPTNPYKAVEILGNKGLFRKFLKENNFNVPTAKDYIDKDEIIDDIKKNIYNFPIMIKPVDSSGSKGITKLLNEDNLEKSIDFAFKFSKSKRVIVEEYIENKNKFMVGGDCFVVNGQVKFWGLLNCHRDIKVNPLVPVGKSYPLLLTSKEKIEIQKEIQRVMSLLDINFGGFNIEVIIGKNNKIYLIEIGPRNGGNMIPDLLKIIYGVDMIDLTVEGAIGNNLIDLDYKESSSFYATHNIHSNKNGILKEIIFSKQLKEKIIKSIIYKNEGDTIEYFDNASKALGILFLKFSSYEEMKAILNKINNLITIIVEEKVNK
ncbi:acetyl-CoA carboxylase biotin carboxylase subunit family protein [uncultured Fusobacterium sp.]|uniref:ATP-grasp domain-containing protein n=1 Tax=uncultured Fusobacterium sp. TaxID=159267 RepID=UPI0025DC27E0|nr:ATP-grasp domain-containing protein [uncultured Fusobacterium sp.]